MDSMKVPTAIVTVMLTGILGLQVWILKEIVDMRSRIVAIEVTVHDHINPNKPH